MNEDFDYRAELAELDEYCSYLDSIFEEELLASWKLILRNDNYALFQNCYGDTYVIKARYINNLFKE